MKTTLMLTLGIVLCSCSMQGFNISENVFSQEQMAHSVGIGTMYLTSGTTEGDHQCDGTPSGCCASGYHMCDNNELFNGGRQIEFSGTGRDTTPFGTSAGDVINGRNAGDDAEGDCTGWSSQGGGVDDRWQCSVEYSGSIKCSVKTSECHLARAQWCCSP